ncbi:hypothetical protein MHK_008002, partial [Candidatus Magnetomorum sp. HK-1]
AADQDPEFRKFFYEKILSQLAKQGMAIIVVSHDERYFHHSDQIIKLDHGQIKKM